MKRVIISIVLILGLIVSNEISAQEKSITLEKALSIVQRQYDNYYEVDFYWLSERTEQWGIFVDENRYANWAHDCAIYTFPNTGNLAVDTIPEKNIPLFSLPPAEPWEEYPLAIEGRIYFPEYGSLAQQLQNLDDVYHTLNLIGEMDDADFQTLLQHVALTKQLKKVILSGVKLNSMKIPDNAFWDRELKESDSLKLRRIVLPKDVVSIGSRAFYETELEFLSLPASVRNIGTEAGYGLKNIRWIYSQAMTPPICENVMAFGGGTPQNTPIYVPIGTAELYKSAPGWDYFKNYIETNKEPSAEMQNVEAESMLDGKAHWKDGCVIIESSMPQEYKVYSINGIRVAEGKTMIGAHTAIALPRQIYIVRIGKKVLKIQ